MTFSAPRHSMLVIDDEGILKVFAGSLRKKAIQLRSRKLVRKRKRNLLGAIMTLR